MFVVKLRPSETILLRRGRQSKHEVTIQFATDTFGIMTTSPSPAPMMRPTRLPTVRGISHHPSLHARMLRDSHWSAYSVKQRRARAGMAPREEIGRAHV